MDLKSKIYLLLTSFFSFLVFELLLIFPKLVYYIPLIFVFLFLYLTKVLFDKNKINEKAIKFFIYPVISQFLFLLFILIQFKGFFVHYLIVLNSIFLYYFFKTLVQYLKEENLISINNLLSFANFILVYFLSSSLYGFQSLLNMSIWVLMMFFVIILAYIVYFVMMMNKISASVYSFYVLLCSLLMLELSWAISFLPLSYKLSGLILAISYYMLLGLIKHHLTDKLNKSLVKLYLGFGSSGILLILLTSRWI